LPRRSHPDCHAKLEFALRDRPGRSWQCGTVQLDRVLPQRLEASYVAPDGSRACPVMVHHAIFGSLGRMIAILLEHHGGVLPFWLSPNQVAVAPISKEQAVYSAAVLAAFEDAGIRAVAYDSTDTLSRRIVAAHETAVPVMAVVGARDEGRPGEPTRARWLTGRRSASRGSVPPAGEGPPGRPCG
jgi:threonyl-tRNA synthetase